MREIMRETIIAEHDVSHLSAFKLSTSEMIQHFGKGINSYFIFVQFIAFVNFLMFLISTLFIFSEAIKQSELQWNYFVFLTPTFSGNYVYILLVSIFLLSCILFWYRSALDSETGQVSGTLHVGQEIIGNDDIVTSFCKLKEKFSSRTLNIFRFILFCLFHRIVFCILLLSKIAANMGH